MGSKGFPMPPDPFELMKKVDPVYNMMQGMSGQGAESEQTASVDPLSAYAAAKPFFDEYDPNVQDKARKRREQLYGTGSWGGLFNNRNSGGGAGGFTNNGGGGSFA